MDRIRTWIKPILVAAAVVLIVQIAANYLFEQMDQSFVSYFHRETGSNEIYLGEEPSWTVPPEQTMPWGAEPERDWPLAPNVAGNQQMVIIINDPLLEDWGRMLKSYEKIYGGIFRVLDYMEAYAKDGSWDSLLKARASCSAAVVDIRQMELPELTLDQERIDQYAAEGVEIHVFLQEFEQLESQRKSKTDTAMLLSYTLEDDVFMKASVEQAIPAMVDFYREYFTMEYRYVSLYSNYLLLELHKSAPWIEWTLELPYMKQCAMDWIDDPDEVMRQTDRVLDEMQALQTDMGTFLGVSEYTLELVQKAVETDDMELLRGEVNPHDDASGYFPAPEWLPNVLPLYLVTDEETGEKRLVEAGEELTAVPSACYISCGVIALEQVEAYAGRLEQWGLQTYRTWNASGDTYQVLAKSGYGILMVEWTAENTLLYLTEPVGCLIPELYLNVITAE